MHENKVQKEEFELAKKAIYGKTVSLLNSAENIANAMLTLEFSGKELFSAIECIAKTTLNDVNERLKHQLDVNNTALSVISPLF